MRNPQWGFDLRTFPKDARGRVLGFNNLWIVELKKVNVAGTSTYQGKLLAHLQMNFNLSASQEPRARHEEAVRGSRDDD